VDLADFHAEPAHILHLSRLEVGHVSKTRSLSRSTRPAQTVPDWHLYESRGCHSSHHALEACSSIAR
jgi:hypothetical protein